MKATERTRTVADWVCDTCKTGHSTQGLADECCVCEYCEKRPAVVRERYKDCPPNACASCARSRQRRSWRDSLAILTERIAKVEHQLSEWRTEQADLQAKLDAPIRAKVDARETA